MKHNILLCRILFPVTCLIAFSLGITFKDRVLSLFSAPRFMGSLEEFCETTKQSESGDLSVADLKLICKCYLSDTFSNMGGNGTSDRDVFLFEDSDYFYVLLTQNGRTSYAAERYGIKINRKTGSVFNKYDYQWRTYGYTAKTVDEIGALLNESMGVEEILSIMGRPFMWSYARDGCLSLEYNTNNGIIFVNLKNGLFFKVSFFDHNTAIRL